MLGWRRSRPVSSPRDGPSFVMSVLGDGGARRRNDLGGESGQLLDVLVLWHEVDGVETSLVDELGDDVCPYLGRGDDRLGSRTGAGALAGLHPVGDGPDRLDDPADVGGYAAGRLCGGVDTVLPRRFGFITASKGRDPSVGLSADEVQHAGSHGAEPDADVVCRGGPRLGVGERVALAVKVGDAVGGPQGA